MAGGWTEAHTEKKNSAVMTNEFFPLGDCFHFLWVYSCPRRLFGPLRFEKLQVYTVNLSWSSRSSLSARLLFCLSLIDSRRSANSSKRRLKTSVVRKHVAASEISSKRSDVTSVHMRHCGSFFFFLRKCRLNRTVLLRVLNAQLSLIFFFFANGTMPACIVKCLVMRLCMYTHKSSCQSSFVKVKEAAISHFLGCFWDILFPFC